MQLEINLQDALGDKTNHPIRAKIEATEDGIQITFPEKENIWVRVESVKGRIHLYFTDENSTDDTEFSCIILSEK